MLRRWGRPGWELDDPDYTVEREARVLALLQPTPVPAPMVVAADPTGAHCDVPALLLTRLPGHPPRASGSELDWWCRDLAEAFACIHDIDAAAALPTYPLYYDRSHATLPPWVPATPTWLQAIRQARESPPAAPVKVIHRDYHPGNTLWSRGRLTGVVDWTQAPAGPPELDVAHMRWNLLTDHGVPVADQFAAYNRITTGRALEHQPYWDVASLFDLLLDGDQPGDITFEDLRRFKHNAARALAEI